jgi:hypothetical protein
MPGVTPIVNDILQNRVDCRAGNQLSQNVLHYRVIGVVGGGLSLQQMATQAVAALGTVYRPWMPILAVFDQVSFQNLMPPATVPFVTGSGLAGTAIGNLVPKQVSGLIHSSTGLAGRSQRGRNYIGFLSDTFTTGAGELSGAGFALLTNIAAAIGPFVTYTLGALSTTLQLIVRHPDLLGPPILPNGTNCISYSAESGLATQRRRGDFGRSN